MSKLKVDEKHIAKLCTDITLMMRDIVRDIETIEDKEKDLFSRYMSLVRLGVLRELKNVRRVIDMMEQKTKSRDPEAVQRAYM